MLIKVLGPGCMNCTTLARRTEQAAQELNIDFEMVKITDYPTIAAYGVLKTPALVVDEKMKFYGRVPTVNELKEILSKEVNL